MMTDPLGLIPNSGPTTPLPPGSPGERSAAAGGPSFRDVLMQNLEQVNSLQLEAEKAIEDVAAGRRDDIDAVLLAKQKADIAFQTLLQVRNKLVDAYEEIKQMRV